MSLCDVQCVCDRVSGCACFWCHNHVEGHTCIRDNCAQTYSVCAVARAFQSVMPSFNVCRVCGVSYTWALCACASWAWDSVRGLHVTARCCTHGRCGCVGEVKMSRDGQLRARERRQSTRGTCAVLGSVVSGVRVMCWPACGRVFREGGSAVLCAG